jgi:hypothetical protein
MQISFYQNIDNVIQNNEKVVLIKALAGSTEYQQQVFVYLNLLDETTVEQDKIEEISDFFFKVNVKRKFMTALKQV